MKFFKKILHNVKSDSIRINDDSDAIFSLTSASVLMEEKLSMKFSGIASLCIKISNGSSFKTTIEDCKCLLDVSKHEFKYQFKTIIDSYDYLWFIIIGSDPVISSDSVTNAAATISSIGDIIEENGFTQQILATIFKFKFSSQNSTLDKWSVETSQSMKKEFNEIEDKEENIKEKKDLYLIYNYKTNNFYPYLPINEMKRNTSLEMKIISILKDHVSVENDFSKWFPIKGIPF